MAYDPKIINTAYGIAKQRGASSNVLLALFEAGEVESRWTNHTVATNYDSLGYLQQRPSQGWPNPTNVTVATNSFLDRAIAYEKAHPGATAEQIAQAVQTSGLPARYGEERATAIKTLGTVDENAATLAATTAALNLPGDPLTGIEGALGDALGALLERIGKAADAFTSKAKIVESIATSTTKIFLPSSLLRGAAGVIGAVLLCFALYFLGRELRA
jgi:hypothetical protein